MPAFVTSVGRSAAHSVRKPPVASITLIAGLGVDGDAHLGETVQHLSRIERDPDQPNLRQVHLIHAELFEELSARGFDVQPGEMGENITTMGIDLLGLPTGTRLRLGGTATVEVTGLRNPCGKLDGVQEGLMSAVLDRAADGTLFRMAGVMGVVVASGEIRPGDRIEIEYPDEPYRRLEPV